MTGVQAALVGTPGSAAAAQSVNLAREIERLSISDPDAAAAGLSRLSALVRVACEDGMAAGTTPVAFDQLQVQLHQLDEQLDELAGRLRAGHVKGVAGIERRVRQLVLTAGLPMPTTVPDGALNR